MRDETTEGLNRAPLIAPAKAGEKSRMKESYREEIANHTGPESCEDVREGALEALTGETTGRAIEPRNRVIIREADLRMARGRQHCARRPGEACVAPARSENLCMWGSF